MSLKDALRAALIGRLLKDLVADADTTVRADALAQLLAAHDALGVKSVDITLPDGTRVGTATLTTPRPGITIDEAAFMAWVQATHPGEVVAAVREPFRRAVVSRLKVDGDRVVDTRTGEVVAWARVRPAPPTPTTFSVRFTDGGRHAIEAAWRAGRLNPLSYLPGRALDAGDGGE